MSGEKAALLMVVHGHRDWGSPLVSAYSDISQKERCALGLSAPGHQPGCSHSTPFCHSFFVHLLPSLGSYKVSFNVASNYPSGFQAQSLLGFLFALELVLLSTLCSVNDPVLKERHFVLLNCLYTFHSRVWQSGEKNQTKPNPNTLEQRAKR